MNRGQLIAEFRSQTRDYGSPPLFTDEQIDGWLDEAQEEAAIRARLLYESENADLCEISVTAGQSVYPLNPALYEIVSIARMDAGVSTRRPIKLVSPEWLDDNVSDWRDKAGATEFAIQNDQSIRFVPRPSSSCVVLMEGYRLPLGQIAGDDDNEPEIHKAHHRALLQWVLHRAYMVPDSEAIDLDRSARAEAEFVRIFGLRPDSSLRRSVRHDEIQHVKGWY